VSKCAAYSLTHVCMCVCHMKSGRVETLCVSEVCLFVCACECT